MRKLCTPFFGMPEDAGILGEIPPANDEVIAQHSLPAEVPSDIPLGFMPHQGENRATRRKASATWVPPKQTNGAGGIAASGGPPWPPAPAERMPTRRELFERRRKHQCGKLDPELRRLQHERLKQK